MNTITDTIWDIITENDELHAELTRIMRREYEPFLTHKKATYVNTYKLEQHIREELTKWYEWLPDTAISQIGGELAMEAFRLVDWKHIAGLILDELQAAG